MGMIGDCAMKEKEIQKLLMEQQDTKFRDFQSGLIPGEGGKNMIGVRTPALRSLAKALVKKDDIGDFLSDLPHEIFEENQLHAFIISEIKDYDLCMEEVNRFLPYVNNWATCDQMNPKVFGKKGNREKLLSQIKIWLKSKETYEIRFGIRMLMCFFLDEDFDPKYLKMVSKIRSEEYYVNMMIAWYLATALAKQYDATVSLIEAKTLSPWVQNKTIQKAVESFRVSDERKTYLRTLKV